MQRLIYLPLGLAFTVLALAIYINADTKALPPNTVNAFTPSASSFSPSSTPGWTAELDFDDFDSGAGIVIYGSMVDSVVMVKSLNSGLVGTTTWCKNNTMITVMVRRGVDKLLHSRDSSFLPGSADWLEDGELW